MVRSRAFWSSLLGLPVVVARAHSFVTIETRGNTEALPAALLAEEHAWFVVLCPAAPPCALIWALCLFNKLNYLVHSFDSIGR